ncbi:beta-ketoacyl-[acyl-carrier-protein] synthase family protein [Acinetobacter sp. S40]|uniref:beta-ketoacyl-[acyl-carrier-protein] synthase family protein n=1 Tax=unclassified Acinetobacter TaxID=196816 RepID=UPI00190A1F5B|nr:MULTISPECIES: beta-ketoacyl-[acyl-carrier-protein] synthase family protein [unclassified Acinetobacter]MBJ9985567.1 beta-ketoacyl-[acyl-carrier-protein] synthase family protein [Acinetobacter sp. S40]MBK0064605.1 beta-ketoacyl-[acyl-carrier-protein] synthase family protein [Acinetobacter sp. S55]MBK0068006.1 beta-ketoacyl-[acyl-carrier-protein] synthase family protein [Acinetobacter sp. S54]
MQQESHPCAVGIQFSCSLSALGQSSQQLREYLTGLDDTLSLQSGWLPERPVWVGAYTGHLIEDLPSDCAPWASRNLRFAITALQQIERPLRQFTQHIHPSRLAIIVGTSTSGISDNEPLLAKYFEGKTDISIDHHKQEMNALAKGLQAYLGWQGAAYTISTACSSSAKAFIAGQRLLQAGIADAVLVGGVDTLCRLTLNGFYSLESLSTGICQPCGLKREGINIGEAASLFLLTPDSAPVMFLGGGESMDAWHISAPQPEGLGAAQAMQRALAHAQLNADQIDYLNLHGTATLQNDAMEIKAVRQVFADHPVHLSSSKHKTGHCLGAAGAVEAYICQQVLLDHAWLPLHQQGEIDPELADQNFVYQSDISKKIVERPLRYVMSNSFAFGGSNVSLVFARTS